MKYIIDVQATSSYSDIYNEPCNCVYCKNYEKMFASSYPEVVNILQRFGISIERPLEIMDCFWNDTKNKRKYESYYSVKGELFEDQVVIYDKDAVITLYRSDTDALIYSNTGMEKPYFFLVISNIELSWALPKNLDD